MDHVVDIKALRQRVKWRQERLARFLGVATSSVSHMENGRPPSGPVLRLLDLLQGALDAGDVEHRFPDHFSEAAE
ncbi:helix-turn-helix domain-containing protein [Rhizobium sp. VS19-DR104.2]|nr:helix-turn-helix domain-containing protein [Rhizobium sp. VS19-DR96]MBZ5766900.1 helix-turn-helix domain-containing protein [Rhizobium sp. VS19-DR129.2]MBZ5773107.1 helix-turn-helix domain-containing protein [Rhizobium sp. VS19-DRK62.2]MBZ5784091.1 helix-turn-helix domain-containing protein [Rhizobium sp. VS19-DR121]MBZ5802451.1 helix-turn-helix domain-containing protein [Rhizobium sp. VS19-DR181]MBZ5818471.1 helix-turn-helix domain-containing protein [Rhizobium sp. VS19-DR183]MBZ5829416.1